MMNMVNMIAKIEHYFEIERIMYVQLTLDLRSIPVQFYLKTFE